jgi:hypothetical protein
MALATSLRAAISAVQTGTNDYGGVFTPSLNYVVDLVDGVAAGAADQLFCDERTVASASNDDLDLAGVLQSAFGQTLTMVKIVAIMIINAPRSGAANTTNLTVGAGTNPFLGFLGGTTPTVGPLRPGATFYLACDNLAGLGSVTAGTADILRIANSSGAAATYQIAIVARSA